MIATIIRKTLTSSIAPMVWIMTAVSMLIGFLFATELLVRASSSLLFHSGVVIDQNLWGGILFVAASTVMTGIIMDKDKLISVGGLAAFMCWLFACIGLIVDAYYYIFLTMALLHLTFYGYVVLATSLGYLKRGKFKEQ